VNRRSDWFAMRLSRDEREQIELLAEREGVPFSVAVRGAIRRAIQESEPRRQSGVDKAEARSFASLRG
jgi:hypothetical protein